jgi:hypothetical protein
MCLCSEDLRLHAHLLRVLASVFEYDLVGVDPLSLFSTHQCFFGRGESDTEQLLVGVSAPKDLNGKRTRFLQLLNQHDPEKATEFSRLFPGTYVLLE